MDKPQSSRLALSILAFIVASTLYCAFSFAHENALPADVAAIFEKATSIELLSIDPHSHNKGKTGLDAYKSLGSTTLKGDAAKAVYTALKDSMTKDNDPPAKCFNPRHALCATVDGKTAVIVICFECNQAQAFIGNEKENYNYFQPGHAAKELFDKILTDAKIPLEGSAEAKK